MQTTVNVKKRGTQNQQFISGIFMFNISPHGIKSCRKSMENDIYSFPQGCLMAGCLNGGSCLFDEGKDAFACSCSPQWRGE